MFLPGVLLLFPMILATGSQVEINNYIVKFMSEYPSILESINVNGDPSEELNLSRLNITDIKDNAFENVSHIKILNLSSNLLTVLRPSPFAILKNVEYVSRNIISEIRKPFSHLNNLNLLDLSNNRISELMAGDFFGLTKSCVILLKGNNIFSMSTQLFRNTSHPIVIIEDVRPKRKVSLPFYPRVKICINASELISAERYIEGEELANDCSTDRIHADGFLRLNSSRIAGFQEGWYKLENASINHINLTGNHITHLISEIFNHLPESVSSVNLAHQKIVELKKDIIVNMNLRKINFENNDIIKIDDDVFIKTKLTALDLGNNKLKDTKFVATLPPTLTEIILCRNEIAEIFPESFSKLNKLEGLRLEYNHITGIRKDSLRGLTALESLNFSNNKLQRIEVDSFKDLTNLRNLHLQYNDFNTFDLGIFSSLKNIRAINLEHNKIRKLTRDTAVEFPDGLRGLNLQYNEIQNLKTGTFANSPIDNLYLSHNNITNIEDGSFNVPLLQRLELSHNFLSVVDTRTYQDLKSLRFLDVSRNNITRIEKGAFENSRTLCWLRISGNPIKRLENGTLHALPQTLSCRVDLKNVPIEIIHGGIFDSV